MLDCKRVLDGAKAELHILDVKDVEPEKIQSHLAGCLVRTFSSLFFLSLQSIHTATYFMSFSWIEIVQVAE